MITHPAAAPAYDYRAAFLSALFPGLGQALRGDTAQGAGIFVTAILVLAADWAIGRVAGISAALFILMLLILPWWALQSYAAGLPSPAGTWAGLQAVWSRAHDIRFLGALFLLTALTDFYIIVANPEYALTIFCTKPAGVLGIFAKAQSPTLHILIGYGFMRLRRWALFLYMAYASFGLLNATTNFACFGYGRVRTAFLLTLVGFTLYVAWRRPCFRT